TAEKNRPLASDGVIGGAGTSVRISRAGADAMRCARCMKNVAIIAAIIRTGTSVSSPALQAMTTFAVPVSRLHPGCPMLAANFAPDPAGNSSVVHWSGIASDLNVFTVSKYGAYSGSAGSTVDHSAAISARNQLRASRDAKGVALHNETVGNDPGADAARAHFLNGLRDRVDYQRVEFFRRAEGSQVFYLQTVLIVCVHELRIAREDARRRVARIFERAVGLRDGHRPRRGADH